MDTTSAGTYMRRKKMEWFDACDVCLTKPLPYMYAGIILIVKTLIEETIALLSDCKTTRICWYEALDWDKKTVLGFSLWGMCELNTNVSQESTCQRLEAFKRLPLIQGFHVVSTLLLLTSLILLSAIVVKMVRIVPSLEYRYPPAVTLCLIGVTMVLFISSIFQISAIAVYNSNVGDVKRLASEPYLSQGMAFTLSVLSSAFSLLAVSAVLMGALLTRSSQPALTEQEWE
ncbi:uncharacterized protein LOC106178029 [Lingula anatina]|uniref:Uncharacterized protein LOC106178029 n=1 Tax=Lingula anatina TaxID=7574 RepID=A0A1S3K255_LINAN|nr:uncharacterized protein LOC106178029 [Lingula anatina]|eukprot:XP_013416479.1 uncharacterized protein LOC106178029 [Lingula anatina]